MVSTLPCSPRSIPYPFTTNPGLCCDLPACAAAGKQSQQFAVCGRGGQHCGAGRSRVSCASTAALPPTLFPLGPFPCCGVTPALVFRACGQDRCLGRYCSSGGDAACMGLGAPAPGLQHLLGWWRPLNRMWLWVAGLKAMGFSPAGRGEGAAWEPMWGTPVSAPHSGHCHPGPGEAGGRDRSLWGHHTSSLCKTVRLADAAHAGSRDAPVPAGPTAWGQHNPGPAPCPGPCPRPRHC